MADLQQPVLQACATCGALMDVTDEDLFARMHCPTCGAATRVRTQFANFELQEILGAGGMGSVYRALDINLHRQIALKVLRKEYSENPEFIAQFAHEAAITAHVNHPNVVNVYSSGSEQGLFYIAMELVDLGSLDDLMTTEEKVGEEKVLTVGIHVAKGLEAAFQRGLIHRDVKPGNILFAEGNTAKIVDFGLAVPMEQAGTLDGEIWGTPYYVAPEKLDGRPEDFRSDMYSLAASLFHALAGKPPYEVEDASITSLKEIKSKPVSLQGFAPGVSSATAYVVDRAMHADPDERYPSYAELIASLEYALSELKKKARQAAAKPSQPLKVKEARTGRWMVTGVVLGILAGGAALYPYRSSLLGEPTAMIDPAAELAQKAAQEAEAEYQSARKQLIQGDYATAANTFRKVTDTPAVTEPIRSWAAFHVGLSATLAGDREGAASEWTKLAERGAFSTSPADKKLADFFVTTAQTLGEEAEPTADVLQNYSRTNYEALAILASAAKSWLSADFETARSLFTAFDEATSSGGNTWVAEYKPIAQAHLADLAEYRSIVDQDRAAPEAMQAKSILPALKEAESRIKLSGPLREAASAKIQEIESRVAAYEAEQERLLAEAEAKDAQALASAQEKAAPIAFQYRFDEARDILAAAPAFTDKGRRDKAAIVRRFTWLGQFKITLVNDLAGSGYPASIHKRTGGQLPGTVSRATDSRVELKSPYGSVPVPWHEIAPESILQMGRSFIRPDFPTERQIERKWTLGVYALFAGKLDEGRLLLGEAAQMKPEYGEMISLFPELGGSL